MDVAIRPYRAGDEPAIAGIWRLALPLDPIAPWRLYGRIFADPNFQAEGLLIAEAGGVPAGFLLAFAGPEGGDGWITALAVAPGQQRAGTGTRLLEAGLRFLAGRGARQALISPYAPNYFWPGVDASAYPAAIALLARHGFRPVEEAVAMALDLDGYAPAPAIATRRAALAGAGLRVHDLEPADVADLVAFNERHFGPDWARAARAAVAAGAHLHRLVLASRGPAVAGFAMYGLYDHHADRFGPFGVDPALRGQGLGTVLLAESLERMRREGLQRAWFLWGPPDGPAHALYLRTGFRVTRRFTVLRRELP